jgi:hypothetical protein
MLLCDFQNASPTAGGSGSGSATGQTSTPPAGPQSHVTTKVTATAHVKVEVHTPLPGEHDQWFTQFKSYRPQGFRATAGQSQPVTEQMKPLRTEQLQGRQHI